MATVEYILIAHTGQYAKRDRLSTYCIAAIEMPTAQMTNFYDAQAYEGILAVFRYKVSWFCQQAKIRQKKTNHKMIGILLLLVLLNMVAMKRLELLTSRLWVVRSNQLSYIAMFGKFARFKQNFETISCLSWGAYYAYLTLCRQAFCHIFFHFLKI